MSADKYTLDAILGQLIEEPAVEAFLAKEAPDMKDKPTYVYIRNASIAQLLANMGDDKKPLFMAMLEIANGREPNYVPADPRKILPRINASSTLTYNIEEIDGTMYMLDHRFSGCVVLRFTKPMNESVYGTVTCNGEKLPQGLIKRIEIAGGAQMFGIPVHGAFTEYDTVYGLHIDGFVDTDGNKMLPQDIEVKTLPKSVVDPANDAHDAIALQAAQEGLVLLKNEGNLLPLHADSAIALYDGHIFRNSAGGAGSINPRYSIGLERAINEYSGFCIDSDADTGMIVISRGSSENFDNRPIPGEFYLTEQEEDTIATLTNRHNRTVAIINSGYPMDLRWAEKYGVHAIIWTGFPGMLGGKALVEILDGRVNPSGKLPDTWSLDYFDIPASANFYHPDVGEDALSTDSPYYINTCYEEDIYVGYRYFETFDKAVAYPFGHGLSYSHFSIDAHMNNLSITVEVQNTGAVPGKEVVQIYAQIPDGKLEQPSRRLIAFAKTRSLQPGEAQELIITVSESELSSFDTEKAQWIIEKGMYVFFAGNSIKQLEECGKWFAEKDVLVKQVENLMVPPVAIEALSKADAHFPEGRMSGILPSATELTPQATRKHYSDEDADVDDMVSRMTVEELARLSVCAAAGWGMHEKGEAGKIFRLEQYDIPIYTVADGNSGVKVNKPNIGMPASNTVCATFNPQLAYDVGRIIAAEAKQNDIHMILAPGMNIHRNPLNGRHPEYFSEDPYLTGVMAGYQSKGLEENGVGSSLKHVACNNCESSRKRNHTLVSERALREIYMRAYAVAIDIHKPASIMTAYNGINGVYTGADEELIYGIFRRELGFDGFVMTDWNSYDTVDIAAAISAGNCWMTPGTLDDTFVTPIIQGVKDGKIPVSRLRSNVRNMLRVVSDQTRKERRK